MSDLKIKLEELRVCRHPHAAMEQNIGKIQ
jgi:hypothetical protein